jgi:RHS repeat-associated protein
MLGQRVAMTATVPSQGLSNHQTTFEYDQSYQLLKATYPNVAPFSGEVDSWTYDAIGNRLTNTVNGATTNYTYQKIGANPNNWQRLLSDGSNTYTYTANGSTATRNGPGGNFAFAWTGTYTWDNRLYGISGATTASYVYDYQGRRSTKTVGSATTYLYDGLNLVREAGASSADYLFGPGIDEPLAMSRGGQLYYYETDALGSVDAVTNSSASVQNNYLYDAWGQVKSQTGSLANPFTYTSRETGEAGLSFYRARYYSSGVGRFLQEDPLDSAVRGDLYDYVENDPISFGDPLGLEKCYWQLMTITAYCDRGPGSDWSHYKPRKPGAPPKSVGPGTGASANINPDKTKAAIPAIPYGCRFTAYSKWDRSPFYKGHFWDTGNGWDAGHQDVPPDTWVDIWLPCKKARKFGVQQHWVKICCDDCPP